MRRGRRDTRLGLHVAHHVQAEVIGEVRPGAVIGDDLRALVGGHLRLPALVSRADPPLEVLLPLRVGGRVGRVHGGELLLDRFGDALAVVGIQPIVRVAGRMDVAHRARDLAGGDLQDLGGEGGVEVAVRTGLDLRVAGLRDERGQPADLQLAAHRDQEVRLVQLEDEAGFRLDEMRVLVAARERLDLDLVPAHFAGDGGQVLGGGDDVEGGAGGSGGHQAARGRERDESRHLHDLGSCDQKVWAPWAPMENCNWKRNSLALMPSP